jgi:SAM-dependent methyltransferase
MNKLIAILQKALRNLAEIPAELRVQRLSQPIPVIRNREELGTLLNLRNLRGKGAEIGVCKATFSREVLLRWGGTSYFAIDPWKEYPKDQYVDLANRSQAEQDKTYDLARGRLAEFGSIVEILRMTSAEAAARFGDESLDFVYVDGQHHYEAVVEDLSLWYPKVRPGGLLCGHDYLDGFVDNAVFGVKRAVDEFAHASGLPLIVSQEKMFPSWFLFKPTSK